VSQLYTRRRPVSAIPRPVGRRPGQDRMVQPLSCERTRRFEADRTTPR